MPTAVQTRSIHESEVQESEERSTGRGAAERPVGRAEVMAAVLEAATELFAARGPDAVTVRQVADRAGVNHALIHRHYGTKEELLRVVLARALNRMAAVAEGVDDTRDGVAAVVGELYELEPSVRLVTWAILAGHPMDELWPEYPAIARLRTVLDRERSAEPSSGRDRVDPGIAVVTGAATVLGWMVFRPLLERAAGLDEAHDVDEQELLTRSVHQLLDQAR